MTNRNKIALIIISLLGLNLFFGLDVKFTIMNLIWCIPFAYAIVIKKEK